MADNPIAAALAKSGWTDGTTTKTKRKQKPKVPPVEPDILDDEDPYSEYDDDSGDSTTTEYWKRQKLKADTRMAEIKAEKELNELIPTTMMISIVAKISQSIQTNFVDFARREAPGIASTFGVPEREREVELFLSEKIEEVIIAVKVEVERFINQEEYEG
jgi:ribonucleotide reductase alpha subunit